MHALTRVATDVEGIFRLSGSAKRIKDLQGVFNSPDRYGKGLDWTGYTVHDAANILRRYLNQLPEPIVPLEFYERFREPLRSYQSRPTENGEAHSIDMSVDQHGSAVVAYQKLITELPPLNRQLLLYILDLLAVFASKSDLNRMTAANLAAIFQPGIISHPNHDMAPTEYRLSQDVLIFLIENQDNFLIGMTGTGVDEKTKAEVESGAPSVRSPKSNIGRSASNASGGADSLRKSGVRRNVSVSSHNSRGDRGSPGVSSPGTPTGHSQFQPNPGPGGIARSNTVPSKRSPAIAAGRFRGMQETSPAASPVLSSLGPDVEPSNASLEAAEKLQTEAHHPTSAQPIATTEAYPAHQAPAPVPINTAALPNRERKISNLFARSPIFAPADPNRPQRKLQKRSRIPGSANESAENSQASLQGEDPSISAFHTPLISPELNSNSRADPMTNPALTNTAATPTTETVKTPTSAERPMNYTPQQPPHLQPPRSPVASVHSRSSVTDHSEFDQLDAPTSIPASGEKKKSRWRFSSSAKRSDDFPLAPPPPIGGNAVARGSNSSIGSSGGFGRSSEASRPRKSFTNESQATTQYDAASTTGGHSALAGQSSQESTEALRDSTNREVSAGVGEERKGGLFGKWKAKMSERREEKERAKSPPPQGHHPSRHGTDTSEGSNKPRASLSAFAQEHFSPGAARRSFDSGAGGGKSRGPASEASVQSGTATSAPVEPKQGGGPVAELETVKERPLSEATIAPKQQTPKEEERVTDATEKDEGGATAATGLGIQQNENVAVPAEPAADVAPSADSKELEQGAFKEPEKLEEAKKLETAA